MTATLLWTAFFVLAALFLLAAIAKGIARMMRGPSASPRQARDEADREPP